MGFLGLYYTNRDKIVSIVLVLLILFLFLSIGLFAGYLIKPSIIPSGVDEKNRSETIDEYMDFDIYNDKIYLMTRTEDLFRISILNDKLNEIDAQTIGHPSPLGGQFEIQAIDDYLIIIKSSQLSIVSILVIDRHKLEVIYFKPFFSTSDQLSKIDISIPENNQMRILRTVSNVTGNTFSDSYHIDIIDVDLTSGFESEFSFPYKSIFNLLLHEALILSDNRFRMDFHLIGFERYYETTFHIENDVPLVSKSYSEEYDGEDDRYYLSNNNHVSIVENSQQTKIHHNNHSLELSDDLEYEFGNYDATNTTLGILGERSVSETRKFELIPVCLIINTNSNNVQTDLQYFEFGLQEFVEVSEFVSIAIEGNDIVLSVRLESGNYLIIWLEQSNLISRIAKRLISRPLLVFISGVFILLIVYFRYSKKEENAELYPQKE